jgi:hypothetical protein
MSQKIGFHQHREYHTADEQMVVQKIGEAQLAAQLHGIAQVDEPRLDVALLPTRALFDPERRSLHASSHVVVSSIRVA